MTIAERAAFAFAVFVACWPFLIVLHYAGFPDMFSGAASASISAGVLIKVATGP
jgi:hypothetical protein